MSDKKPIVSPSRTYVAICNKTNFDGHYMRKFTFSEENANRYFGDNRNDTEAATWYFMNNLDGFACVEKVITFEDYSNLEDLTPTKDSIRHCPMCGRTMAKTHYAFECLNEECDFLGYKK